MQFLKHSNNKEKSKPEKFRSIAKELHEALDI